MVSFLYGRKLRAEISSILREARCKIAVPYWGTGARARLATNLDHARFVCTLSAEGTDPWEIERIPRTCIRDAKNLHAKIYIGQDRAVVTSANLSFNALGRSPNVDGKLIEAGVLLHERDDLNEWFDRLWEEADLISDADIAGAKRRPLSLRCAPHFVDFDVRAPTLPLLFWRAVLREGTDWKLVTRVAGLRNAALDERLKKGIHVEPGDRARLRPGVWLLTWYAGGSGNKPIKNKNLHWFYTGELLEKSFVYVADGKADDDPYDSILPEEYPPPEPFSLHDPGVCEAIFKTISRNDFYQLRSECDDEQFFTDEMVDLNNVFWEECKKQYLADRSEIR